MSFIAFRRPTLGQCLASRPGAFTLLEILVVVAIMMLLAALLFPVFAQARERARRTTCLSNLKQMGSAMLMYSQDNDGFLPAWTNFWVCATNGTTGGIGPNDATTCGDDTPDRYWDAAIWPYVKSGAPGALNPEMGGVWHCPSSELDERYTSYGYSMGIAVYSLDEFYYLFPPEASLHDATRTVFVGDGGTAGRLGRPQDLQGYAQRHVPGYEWMVGGTKAYSRDAPFRHQDGANYLFCDGHAKWMKASAIYPHPVPPAPPIPDGHAYCSRARHFARTAPERDFYIAQALARGVTCSID